MRVKTPASSANLGPGFDCLGLAWQCYNEIEFLPDGQGLRIEGCDAAYQNRENLAYRGWTEVLRRAGVPEDGLTIRFGRTDIPVSRGLGSSAALIAAGVAAADRHYALGMSERELLCAATAVEGHPDNVAPALFGGLSASLLEGEQVYSVRCGVSECFHFTALIPDFPLSTAQARSVLPATVERSDALHNVSRMPLLLCALETGDGEMLAAAMEDRLHQPYRIPLIHHYEEARALARAHGAAAFCISGAGPTLLCVSLQADFPDAMARDVAEHLPGWRVLELRVDQQGVQFE